MDARIKALQNGTVDLVIQGRETLILKLCNACSLVT